MTLPRAIGGMGLTWLVVNAIVGSAVFGLPADYVKILGPASVLAVIAGGISTAFIVVCFAEVASKIPEAGGSYIYARTVFGRFAGIQVGWFSWAVRLASTAAGASLFVSYLGGLVPSVEHGGGRFLILTLLLGGLTLANYVGVRSGAGLSSAFGITKIVVLLALGLYGTWNSGVHLAIVSRQDISTPGVRNWFEAFLLLSFMYGGFETALLPLGEVRNPLRAVARSLALGLALSVVIYTLVQVAVLNTPNAQSSSRPLAVLASNLFGSLGATITSIAAMICVYGYLCASLLGTPRLTYALAEMGDFPSYFAKIHPRFQTPYISILLFGAGTWLIAVTGSFRIAIALSVGARLVTYGATCATLVPLRRRFPERRGYTVPFGPLLSALSIGMTLVLAMHMHTRETAALVITSSLAFMNWLWLTNKRQTSEDGRSTPW